MVERPSMDLADADAPGVAARRRAADATRRLIGALVASTAPDLELERAATEVDRITEALAPFAVRVTGRHVLVHATLHAGDDAP